MKNLLFVYGTLMDEDNKYGIYLRDSSGLYVTARVRGKLYDIGEYPGAVLLNDGDEYVHGAILQMDKPEEALLLIDKYEGFGDDEPQPNEFIRVLTEAETEKGTVDCWIYLYNLPVDGLIPIEDGRYKKQ